MCLFSGGGFGFACILAAWSACICNLVVMGVYLTYGFALFSVCVGFLGCLVDVLWFVLFWF